MQINELPKITVHKIAHMGNQSVIFGIIDDMKSVGEGYSAYLLVCEKMIFEGKFKDIDEINKSVKFITTGSASDVVRLTETYPFFDGYWGQRAALVFDSSLSWDKIDFKPLDAIKHKDDGSNELIKDGWDHEHCFICWAMIDLSQNTVFMKSTEDDIVCLGCYENYILKKSIAFISD